jgi:eukaryotic-like serine/threonine-protein kinase
VPEDEQNPRELEIEVALAEYMQKCDDGQSPDREAFLARHPELRTQLSELLAAADWIERMAGPTLADIASNRSNPSSSSSASDDTLPHSPIFPNPNEITRPIARIESMDFSIDLDAHDKTSIRPFTSSAGRELTQPILPCRFGDYVLERVLGRGGMGVVYVGRQIHLDRTVAIKMIRSGALASPEEVQRFYAEARSAAKLDHPNIVTVYQCGEHEGHHYFSMDYVDGMDLSRMIADKPMDRMRAARYVRDVARAIQYAHDMGILHRVLNDQVDHVHVTDFGLAKSIGNDTGLTTEGAALGTPSYMSPEQAAGRVDEHNFATDVYSIGAILFTIVTGQPPFKAATTLQTIMQVIHRPAPKASSINSAVDADLDTVIDRCLQKSPERRYATAAGLANDLDRYIQHMPIEARPLPAWRRAWHWLLGVPIFGAVLDNRVVEPTDAHRWVQRGLIASGLLMVLAWSLFLVSSSDWQTNRLPKVLRVAAGAAGGGYERVANALCSQLSSLPHCEATSMNTEGSMENIERLLRRNVDLALLQANTVTSPQIAVVSPLYYEAVHVVVRRDAAIRTLADLRGKRVMVGGEKSGNLLISEMILARAHLTLQDINADQQDWRQLALKPEVAAAIVVVQAGNSLMQDILETDQFDLLPIVDAMDFALDEPTLRAISITSATYPRCKLAEGGVLTVATTAFLASRVDAPDILVEKVLECLFQPEIVEKYGLLTAERAAHWRGLAWHPAARRFFESHKK